MAGVSNTEDRVLTCGECGASVYRNHLDTGLAGYIAGKLLCVHCFKEKKTGTRIQDAPASSTEAPAESSELTSIPLDDPLELAPEDAVSRTSVPMSGTANLPAISETPTRLQRPLNKTGTGATRCRTFHCKLSEEGTRHLDALINEWCDSNPDIEIKFTTSTVGTWTGKHPEPHLIINIFY